MRASMPKKGRGAMVSAGPSGGDGGDKEEGTEGMRMEKEEIRNLWG